MFNMVEEFVRMKKTFVGLCVVAALFIGFGIGCATTAPVRGIPDGVVKVACIGDSITYGTLVSARKKNCYPAKLQQLLGDRYMVMNYGVSAHAMLKTSDKPYWEHRYFQESQEFAPDIVLILLGTNDSKRRNWTDMESFVRDYRDMVAQYQALPSHPEIYLLTPPAAFGDDGPYRLHYSMDQSIIVEMGEAIKLLGETLGLKVVDTYAVTDGHPEYYAWDGIHPNADGADAIANAVYDVLSETFVSRSA